MTFALPSSKLPLVYRHPLQSLINSLPYIDGEIDTKTQTLVDKLIENEMKTMEQQDYLHDLPLPQTKLTDLMKQEMIRIENNEQLDKIDFEQKPSLTQEFSTSHELKEATSNLHMHNQYLQNNIINQELLNKYGKDSWNLLLNSQENEKIRLQKEFTQQQEKLNHINAHRKYEQNEVKYKLDNLKSKISQTLLENINIEIACKDLEKEIFDVQRKKLKLN